MSTTIAMPVWCWLVGAGLLVAIIGLVYTMGYYAGQFRERYGCQPWQ